MVTIESSFVPLSSIIVINRKPVDVGGTVYYFRSDNPNTSWFELNGCSQDYATCPAAEGSERLICSANVKKEGDSIFDYRGAMWCGKSQIAQNIT